jgi:hypothetical protein
MKKIHVREKTVYGKLALIYKRMHMKKIFLIVFFILNSNLVEAAQKSILRCETEDKNSYVVISIFKHDLNGTFGIAAEPITSSLLTNHLDTWSYGKIPRNIYNALFYKTFNTPLSFKAIKSSVTNYKERAALYSFNMQSDRRLAITIFYLLNGKNSQQIELINCEFVRNLTNLVSAT